jgi:hypothetical protein
MFERISKPGKGAYHAKEIVALIMATPGAAVRAAEPVAGTKR